MKTILSRIIWNERLYWIIALLFLVLFFMLQGSPFVQTFYFITFLLPVIVGTTYVFNNFLLPRFLLKANYWKFMLYLSYLVVISLYLVTVVVFLSIAIFTYFQISQEEVLRINLVELSLGMYCIVLVNAFINVFRAFQKNEVELAALEEQQNKNQVASIIVRSNRKQVQVTLVDLLYIESIGDYVQLVTTNDKIITREKIGHLASKMPDNFIRIHRSFIVNKNLVDTISRNKLMIGDIQLPISRSYKKAVETEF